MPVLTYTGDAAAQALAQEYFDVYSDWKVEGVVNPKTIAAKQGDQPGTATYTVTVELLKTPALGAEGLLVGNFNIALTVTSVDSESGSQTPTP